MGEIYQKPYRFRPERQILYLALPTHKLEVDKKANSQIERTIKEIKEAQAEKTKTKEIRQNLEITRVYFR